MSFNSYFRLISKELSKPHITDSLWWESTDGQWFPPQRANNAESIDMSWGHHKHAIIKLLSAGLSPSLIKGLEQNGLHFFDIFNAFSCEKILYLIQISLKLDRKGPLDNKSVLVQVMT